jgi:hypothetical protein
MMEALLIIAFIIIVVKVSIIVSPKFRRWVYSK